MGKMDEMEMYISLKSIKIAWLYTIVFLFIWLVYDYITTSKFGLPFFFIYHTKCYFDYMPAYFKGQNGRQK